MRTVKTAKEDLGTRLGDRFKLEMNRAVVGYVNSMWGLQRSKIKERAKKKRSLKRKNRRERLLMKKIENWNDLEDAKEDKIIRSRDRAVREDDKVPFSFKLFLAQDREQKRWPYVIEDEETFRKRIQEDMQNYLWRPPKSVRKQVRARNTLGYPKRADRELLDPFLLEIRRRARVAELVEQREDAIAKVKFWDQLEEQRKKRFEERHAEFLKKTRALEHCFGGVAQRK